MSVMDLDLTGKHSWQGVLKLLTELCGCRGELAYGVRQVGSLQVPALEIRLDAPAELECPESCREDGLEIDRWKNGIVVLAEKLPERLPEGRVWLLRRSGAGAAAYRAFRRTAELLARLEFSPEFLWSTIPLSPVCDDVSVTQRREDICWASGAIHTLWVRCGEEEALCRSLRRLPPCGQLQVQNMTTANTWIIPQREEKLLQVFQGGA